MILPRLRSLAIALVMPLALPVLWWFATAGSTSPFYPSLETILVSFRDTWLFSHVGSDAIPSLERFLFGYLLAIALGVGLGVLFGRLRLLDAAFQPAIQFSRSIPATALVPVSITLLGIGSTPKIWLIAFVCLFPIPFEHHRRRAKHRAGAGGRRPHV